MKAGGNARALIGTGAGHQEQRPLPGHLSEVQLPQNVVLPIESYGRVSIPIIGHPLRTVRVRGGDDRVGLRTSTPPFGNES